MIALIGAIQPRAGGAAGSQAKSRHLATTKMKRRALALYSSAARGPLRAHQADRAPEHEDASDFRDISKGSARGDV